MDVLECDNQILVIYKESGILSQSDGTDALDLLTMAKKYIKEKYNKPGNVYLGLVHRLDRNTAGPMVFARTSKAASRLSLDVREHNFCKMYLAICEGHFKNKSGQLKDYLFKNEKENKSYICNKLKGKEAVLNYNVLDEIIVNDKIYSLVNIELKTGRHHQIRVQFSHIGHPLYGDVKYGASDRVGNYYALCSYKLSFVHPTLKENKVYYYFKPTNMFQKFYSKDDFLSKYKLYL